jgi:glycosyltransferase involved in cell wall biosynthesis
VKAKVILPGQDRRLDRLQESMRVIGGEQRETASVQCAKRRARVGQGLANDHRDDRRENVHPQPPETCCSVASRSCEARSDDDVCLAGNQRLEDQVQLAGIVLSVPVDLDGDVETVGKRVAVAGLDRAADSEVERKPEKPSAGGLGDLAGSIVGPVVHHENLETGVDVSDLLDDAPDRFCLVERRNDRDPPSREEPVFERSRKRLNGLSQRRQHSREVVCRPWLLQRLLLTISLQNVHICLIYDCLYPYTVGGAERWYRALAERLAEEGYEVTYLTLRQWDPGSEPTIPGVKVVAVGPRLQLYVGGRRRIGPALRFGRGVLRHLLTHGPRYDVVHCASTPFFALLAAGLARRRGRYRLLVDWIEVWTLGYWRSYLGAVKGSIAWAIQRLATRIGERAFCFARMHEWRLRAEGFRGPIDVIGVYAGPLDRPEPLPAEPRVVFAGRLIPEKGVLALPPTIARARKELPELRAEIFGDGPLRDELRDRVKEENLGDAVSLPGFVPEERLREAMRRALCLAFPSSREGYGLVVLEAASCGTPTVVVDGPDNAALELIDGGVNGVVARSAEPENLSNAILQVHDAGDALRESTAGWFERNAPKLSLESSLQTVMAAYRG